MYIPGHRATRSHDPRQYLHPTDNALSRRENDLRLSYTVTPPVKFDDAGAFISLSQAVGLKLAFLPPEGKVYGSERSPREALARTSPPRHCLARVSFFRREPIFQVCVNPYLLAVIRVSSF